MPPRVRPKRTGVGVSWPTSASGGGGILGPGNIGLKEVRDLVFKALQVTRITQGGLVTQDRQRWPACCPDACRRNRLRVASPLCRRARGVAGGAPSVAGSAGGTAATAADAAGAASSTVGSGSACIGAAAGADGKGPPASVRSMAVAGPARHRQQAGRTARATGVGSGASQSWCASGRVFGGAEAFQHRRWQALRIALVTCFAAWFGCQPGAADARAPCRCWPRTQAQGR